jgi:hypothetical protein
MVTPFFETYLKLGVYKDDPWMRMVNDLLNPPIHMQATAIADQS